MFAPVLVCIVSSYVVHFSQRISKISFFFFLFYRQSAVFIFSINVTYIVSYLCIYLFNLLVYLKCSQHNLYIYIYIQHKLFSDTRSNDLSAGFLGHRFNRTPNRIVFYLHDGCKYQGYSIDEVVINFTYHLGCILHTCSVLNNVSSKYI